jgi:hypothetical protein
MAAKQKLVEVKPFEMIPEVPQAFDQAAVVNIEALKAIDYWREMKDRAWTSDQQAYAHKKLVAWQQVNRKAEAVMQSYQLRLI